MKHAVSVSLGNPTRDKRVEVNFAGEQILVERIGTGGDAKKARALFAELDGKVDALGVGGIDLHVRVGKREYPIRAGLKLVRDVRDTPVVDGRALKYVLERRVFELAGDALEDLPPPSHELSLPDVREPAAEIGAGQMDQVADR